MINKLKLTLLSLTIAAFTLPPLTGRGQEVILPSREITARAAIGEIEKQTGYTFVANLENVDAQKVLVFPASRLRVNEILDMALEGSGSVWEIVGNRILITPGKTENTSVVEEYVPRSAMYRLQLPQQQLRAVHDPWSKRQLSVERMSGIRNGNWRSDGKEADSIGMATFNFRVGSTTIEPGYMGNAHTMDLIHRTFSDKEILAEMDFITITAAASPEGNTGHNERLAERRAMAVKTYIMWKYPFMNRENVFTFSIGEDWSGLRRLVEQDYATPYRREVLAILDNEYYDTNTRRASLKRVGEGYAWSYISKNMLPRLRGAAACMIYYKRDTRSPEVIRETDTVYVERVVDRIVEVERPAAGGKPRAGHREDTSAGTTGTGTTVRETYYAPARAPYYWAVGSNLLYDAILLPDLAVELSMGEGWSAQFNGQVAWWNNKTDYANVWRIQAAGLEVRRWLGDRKTKTPLSGHYLGLYGMAGTYDVRLGGRTGHLSNMSYSAGLSYGYSKPIAHSWNIGFGISIGYLGGKYDTYTQRDAVTGRNVRDGVYQMRYFGPTKLRVEIAWLPGGKNPARAPKSEKR